MPCTALLHALWIPNCLIYLLSRASRRGDPAIADQMWLRTLQRFVSLRHFGAGNDSFYGPRMWVAAGLHSLAEGAVHDATAAPPPAADSPAPASQDIPEGEQLLLQVGVVGVPNAGKSTLTNALVGTKVSAVSSKTNTTVHTTLGALTQGATQVVLYDTPGIVGPRHYMNPRHERRVRSAWTVAADCDLLLFIVDAHRQLERSDPRVLRVIAEYGSGKAPSGLESGAWSAPPSVLVLNKMDVLRREQRPLLLALADKMRSLYSFQDVFWVSALRGHGIDELREYLLNRATPGKWTVEGDAVTDRSDEEVAVEIVREKLFRTFYEELPYELDVLPVSFKPLHDGSLRIEHDVIVANENVRKIVVGRHGAAIGTVGKAARLELENMWQRRVHLILNAKTAKK